MTNKTTTAPANGHYIAIRLNAMTTTASLFTNLHDAELDLDLRELEAGDVVLHELGQRLKPRTYVRWDGESSGSPDKKGCGHAAHEEQIDWIRRYASEMRDPDVVKVKCNHCDVSYPKPMADEHFVYCPDCGARWDGLDI